MLKKSLSFLHVLVVVGLVFSLALATPIQVFADDGTPDDPTPEASEAPATDEAPAEEEVTDEAPAEAATEEAATEEAAEEVATEEVAAEEVTDEEVAEEATEEVAEEQEPAEEDTTQGPTDELAEETVGDVVALLAETESVLVDEQGEPISMAEQDTLDLLEISDPWFDAGGGVIVGYSSTANCAAVVTECHANSLTPIQSAIDDARSTGKTITLEPGEYTTANTITINKSLTLTGSVPGEVIVRGTGSDITVFRIQASDVTISNLVITHDALDPFSSPWTEVERSLISIPDGAALTGIDIIDNEIYVPEQSGAMSTWNGIGITVGQKGSSDIQISGNTVYNTRNGIVLRYGNTAYISGNTIYNTKGGVMNYTSNQADADNRTMVNNSWGSVHNEWDIVWNTAHYVPDYQASVLALSQANNDAYVLDRRAADAASANNLTGNRSHVFVLAGSSYSSNHPARGNSNEPFASLALGVDAVVAGGTVVVLPGTYSEGRIVIDKDVTIAGDSSDKAIIQPSMNINGNNAAEAWFLVTSGVTFNLSDVVLDGAGYNVYQAIRSHGNSTISGVDFQDILVNGSPYYGVAISSFGGVVGGGFGSDSHRGAGDLPSKLTVADSTFANIGRIGVLVKGDQTIAEIYGITYTGKGSGDWLDYGIEIGAGGQANIHDNVISGNTGIASTDGSTSAGILVTDYWGPGTTAAVNDNTIMNNTTGLVVGYNSSDASVATASGNRFISNENGIVSSGPLVTAKNNWWGAASGPLDASALADLCGLAISNAGLGGEVSGCVIYSPWLTADPWTDADSDGVDDSVDNCPSVANPGQSDNDHDGIGNDCDATPDGKPDNRDDKPTDTGPTTATGGGFIIPVTGGGFFESGGVSLSTSDIDGATIGVTEIAISGGAAEAYGVAFTGVTSALQLDIPATDGILPTITLTLTGFVDGQIVTVVLPDGTSLDLAVTCTTAENGTQICTAAYTPDGSEGSFSPIFVIHE